jgi:hypothetical protein
LTLRAGFGINGSWPPMLIKSQGEEPLSIALGMLASYMLGSMVTLVIAIAITNAPEMYWEDEPND